jgi:hypothetical protein
VTRFWRCDRGNKNGCKVRVHTNEHNNVVKQIGIHNHDSDAARIETYRFKRTLKRRAIDTIEVGQMNR